MGFEMNIFLKKLIFNHKYLNKSDFNKINYEKLIKISSSELLIPLLYYKLKKLKKLTFVPTDFKFYINEIYEINRNRNEILIDEVFELSKILNSNKINHVFLKGVSYLHSGIFEDLGVRMIGDIDFLIDKINIEKYIEISYQHNYNFHTKDEFIPSRHLTRQINDEKLFAIEAHTSLFDNNNIILEDKFLSNKSFKNGLYMPSNNDMLNYNVLSFQINDHGYRKYRYSFRNLYDTHRIILSKKIGFMDVNPISNRYFLFAQNLDINVFESKYITENKIIDIFLIKLFLKYKFLEMLNANFWSFIYFLKFIPKKFINFFILPKYRSYIFRKFFNK